MWWPARELFESLIVARRHLPELLREAEEMVERGWEPRADFELHLNTILRDLGHALRLDKHAKERVSVISAALTTFAHLRDTTEAAPVERDPALAALRERRAYELGKGRIGEDKTLDMVPDPVNYVEQRTAVGAEPDAGRPKV